EPRAELSALYNRLHGEDEERQCYLDLAASHADRVMVPPFGLYVIALASRLGNTRCEEGSGAAPGEDEIRAVAGQEAQEDPPHGHLAQREAPPHVQELAHHVEDRARRQGQEEHEERVRAHA